MTARPIARLGGLAALVLACAHGVAAFAHGARADAPAGGAPCATEPYRDRGTAIGCPELGFVAVVPGRGWTLRTSVPGSPRVLLAARLPPHFQVTVSTAERPAAGGAAVDPQGFLLGLYARAAEGGRRRGLELSPPELGESRPNRPTLAYEARGLVVGGAPHRSLHVWTFADRPGGPRLVYHASWTGPADAFDADLPAALEAMTAGFVLVDEAGGAIPD